MAGPKLYYSPGACSLASHIALEEAGVPFEAARIDFGSAEQRSTAFLAINPKGRVPALVDGDLVVTENPAILRYVSRLAPAGRLWPEEPRAEARCAEWVAWCSSGLHPSYAHIRRAERYATSEAGREDVVATGRLATRAIWDQAEAKIAGQGTPWLAGEDYSVADAYAFVFWTWGRGPALGYDMPADFPAWTAHAHRVGERAAVRRALEREGVAAPS